MLLNKGGAVEDRCQPPEVWSSWATAPTDSVSKEDRPSCEADWFIYLRY